MNEVFIFYHNVTLMDPIQTQAQQTVPISPVQNTSGQGKASVVPPEIMGWSWGAFFLNFIWGICNGVYISLLTLIPIVNIVMIFILGARGKEWAWRNKRWESVEQFKRVQKTWSKVGVWVFIGTFCFWIVMMAIIVVVLFSTVIPTTTATKKPAESFVNDVRTGQLDSAYGLLSGDLQSKLSSDQFQSFVQSMPAFKDVASDLFSNVSIDSSDGVSRATLRGSITSSDGKIYPVTVGEVETNGVWQINSIEFQ